MTVNINDFEFKMPTTTSPRTDANTSGEENFSDSLVEAFVREEIQNSMDAVRDPSKPVSVEISIYEMPMSDVPEKEKIADAMMDSFSYWNNPEMKNKKMPTRIVSNINELGKITTPTVRLSDHNTIGLTGVNDKFSRFANLTKNNGVSNNTSPGQTGSFGLGKNVSIKCSGTGIVIYATKNIDGECATIGNVRMPSYEKDGVNYTGEGYLCKRGGDDFKPIMDCISFEDGYQRTDTGTDKYIFGFNIGGKCVDYKEIIYAALDNYLVAFFTGKLELSVAGDLGTVKINAQELPRLIKRYANKLKKTTVLYYNVLTNPTTVCTKSVYDKDDVTVYLLISDNPGRDVCVVRPTGMKIFDVPRSRYNTLSADFAAVIMINGGYAASFATSIETPEHNRWNPGKNVGNPKKANEFISNVCVNTVIDEVQKFTRTEYPDTIDFEQLSDYLPAGYVSASRGRSKKKPSSESSSVSVKVSTKKQKNKTAVKRTPTVTRDTIVNVRVDAKGNIKEEPVKQETKKISKAAGKRQTQLSLGGKGVASGTDKFTPRGPREKAIYIMSGDGNELMNMRQTRKGHTWKRSQAYMSCFVSLENNRFVLDISSQVTLYDCWLIIYRSGEERIPANIKEITIDGSPCDFHNNFIHVGPVDKNRTYHIEFSLKYEALCALEVEIGENPRKQA